MDLIISFENHMYVWCKKAYGLQVCDDCSLVRPCRGEHRDMAPEVNQLCRSLDTLSVYEGVSYHFREVV